jgi:uncharacterized protein (UPF0210 family)
MLQTRSARARALRSVRCACYVGLDAVTLREEVARHIREVVLADGYSFATIHARNLKVGDGLAEGT